MRRARFTWKLSQTLHKYHYCSYWGTWSRILGELPNGQVVELNLTPVGNSAETWKDAVASETIRVHGTAPGLNDRFTDALPESVANAIRANVGEEMYLTLTTFDYMPLIDFKAQVKHSNGGTPFVKCKR